ncbi:hypothetical protein ACOSQ3_025021 [Xanthoceras sorbifolium]
MARNPIHIEESHEVLAFNPRGIGRSVEEITTFRNKEELVVHSQKVSKGKCGAPLGSIVVRRKHNFTAVIAEDEPDWVKCSLRKVTWAVVDVNFVPQLLDTIREFTPPPPSIEQEGHMLGKDSEGSADCGLQRRLDRKGKNVIVIPPLVGEGPGARADNLTQVSPLSTYDILARAAFKRLIIKKNED